MKNILVMIKKLFLNLVICVSVLFLCFDLTLARAGGVSSAGVSVGSIGSSSYSSRSYRSGSSSSPFFNNQKVGTSSHQGFYSEKEKKENFFMAIMVLICVFGYLLFKVIEYFLNYFFSDSNYANKNSFSPVDVSKRGFTNKVMDKKSFSGLDQVSSFLAKKRLSPTSGTSYVDMKWMFMAEKVYKAVQKSITHKDLRFSEKFLGEKLLKAHLLQIENLKKSNHTNIVSDINIVKYNMHSMEDLKIVCAVDVNMRDYIVDNRGQIIKGVKGIVTITDVLYWQRDCKKSLWKLVDIVPK